MYIDPHAPLPGAQTTSPSSAAPAPAGVAGSSLDAIIHAADNGTLRVDPATGDATLAALTAVEEEISRYRRQGTRYGMGGTRLGGGYAEQIDRFNGEWTSSGAGSAFEVMDQYVEQLGRLREAVRKSMATYRATDEASEQGITRAGTGG